jgi:hypothetical protein
MNASMFIKVDALDKNGNVLVKYINKNQILTIRQEEQNIVIEMSDYTEIRLPNQNIHIFMDRFK